MAEHEAIGISPPLQRRRARPFAHWVAAGAACGFVVVGQLGVRSARAAFYPVCTGSTSPVPGGNWLLVALLVLAPTTLVAGTVSLVRGPRRLVSATVSIGAIAVVLLLWWHNWLEMVDWGMGCGY